MVGFLVDLDDCGKYKVLDLTLRLVVCLKHAKP